MHGRKSNKILLLHIHYRHSIKWLLHSDFRQIQLFEDDENDDEEEEGKSDMACAPGASDAATQVSLNTPQCMIIWIHGSILFLLLFNIKLAFNNN